jgi:hypothetical protein
LKYLKADKVLLSSHIGRRNDLLPPLIFSMARRGQGIRVSLGFNGEEAGSSAQFLLLVVTKGRCLPLMAFPKESYHLNDRRVI